MKIYNFLDNKGTFRVKNAAKYKLYFPLTNKDGSLLSSISPNLAGDIKKDNDHFLNIPASIEDVRSNLLCRREFFIKSEKELIRLSYPYKDYIEAGFFYHKVFKETSCLTIEIINFIPYDMRVEVMWVRVRNKSSKRIRITPTSFLPLYGRGEKSLRDHRHVSSLLNRVYLDSYGIMLKPTMVFNEKGHAVNNTVYFTFGYEDDCLPPRGQFPTLDYFFGQGDIISPDAVRKNIPAVTRMSPEFDGKEACASFRFRQRSLKSKEEANYFLIMGIEENSSNPRKHFNKLNLSAKIEASLEKTKIYWQKYLAEPEFDFKDKDFNNWLLWVKAQPTLRKLFGCSFLPHFDYGKGGRGWRDLWQDALTLIFTEPKKAGDLILTSIKGVRIDGSNATIVTRQGDFISDRNRINRVWMDHGVWPYLTIKEYIHKTGNMDILLTEVPYFKDHLLMRSRHLDSSFTGDDFRLYSQDGELYKGTVLEHILLQNLVQFFNVGKHNIIRLENADWNDGLDMAPENGESVTFSFMYAHNLGDICEILQKLKTRVSCVSFLEEICVLLDRKDKARQCNYNDFRQKQGVLNEYLKKAGRIKGRKIKVSIDDLIYDLKAKARHLSGWLREKEWLRKEGFFNGYYDNSSMPAEGRRANCVRMMLPTQVFAIMSGVADEEQIRSIWRSVEKYLKDKNLGGFRLNSDYKNVYMNLGRAFGFSYGDKENGAFFNHMAVMFANALYKRGFLPEASEVARSIYKMATNIKAQVYPLIPEYFNSEGRGLYLYLTGSASWYIYTLLREILGVKFNLQDIILEPKLLLSEFFRNEIDIGFSFLNKIIRITFVKGNNLKTCRINKVYLEGKSIPFSSTACVISRDELLKIPKKEISVKVHLSK